MGHMYRGKEIRSLESERRFNPALLSNVENQFIADHIGDSPAAALKDGCGGANATTVRPLLQFIFDMIEEGKVAFIGKERWAEELAGWQERCELIKETKPHNGGAQMAVELYAKQGSRYVRGGRGSDFGHVRRFAFDFIDDAMPGTLEDALESMTEAAQDKLDRHEETKRDKAEKRRKAEETGVLASDRMVDGQPLFDDSSEGRIKCVVEGCGYQKDWVEEAGDSALPRLKAIRSLYMHAVHKVKHNDLDEGHTRVMFGLKEG